MAKDPAFLFYDGDAARDVSHLNRVERGCYFDLIQAQRKFGRMSLDVIKRVLGKDFDTCWDNLKICLSCVEDMYFIDWLENSVFKRSMYSKSRSKNRMSLKSDTYEKDMKTYDTHMENEIVIEDIKSKKVFNNKPKKEDFNGLPENYIENSIQLIKFTKQLDITQETVVGMWNVFKLQKLTGNEYYANEGKVYSHFIDWLKFQKFNDGSAVNNPSTKSGTSKDRVEALKKW